MATFADRALFSSEARSGKTWSTPVQISQGMCNYRQSHSLIPIEGYSVSVRPQLVLDSAGNGLVTFASYGNDTAELLMQTYQNGQWGSPKSIGKLLI